MVKITDKRLLALYARNKQIKDTLVAKSPNILRAMDTIEEARCDYPWLDIPGYFRLLAELYTNGAEAVERRIDLYGVPHNQERQKEVGSV